MRRIRFKTLKQIKVLFTWYSLVSYFSLTSFVCFIRLNWPQNIHFDSLPNIHFEVFASVHVLRFPIFASRSEMTSYLLMSAYFVSNYSLRSRAPPKQNILPIWNGEMAHCFMSTAHCILPTAHFFHLPFPTIHFLPAAHCLLPIAHCLLVTTLCLLPTVHWSLFSVHCLSAALTESVSTGWKSNLFLTVVAIKRSHSFTDTFLQRLLRSSLPFLVR